MSHGDPFPLCAPPEHGLRRREGRGHARPRRAAQRLRRAQFKDGLVHEALSSLNGLVASRAGTDLRCGSVSEKVRLSKTQESAYRRIRRRVSRYADAPHDLRPRGALQELLKTGDVYSSDIPNSTAPFVADGVRVLKGDLQPKEIEEVAPPHIAEMLASPGEFIERSEQELSSEEPLIEPYWDPLLDPNVPANRSRLLDFLRQLVAAGLVTGVRRKKARIGLFFVPKKTPGSLRLIVDARQPNQLHRLPPSTTLASVEKLLGVSVDPSVVFAELDPDERPAEPETVLGGSVDLQDGFYQFRNSRMCGWFTIDLKVQASELGLTKFWCDEAQQYLPVSPDTWVWPAFSGMAMGWSWGMHVCHEILTSVLERTATSQDSLLLDKVAAPILRTGDTASGPYVDNANVMGIGAGSVSRRLKAVTDELDRLGLKWHEFTDEAVVFEMLGVIIDGRSHRVYHKPRRVWRLYLAVQEIVLMKKLSSRQMRVVLGHFMHLFMLLRPAISVFRACYDFISEDPEGVDIRALPLKVLEELAVAKGLILVAEGSISKSIIPVAFTTDSSLKGYAVYASPVTASEVVELTRRKERSRFSRVEDISPNDAGFLGELADPDVLNTVFIPPPRRVAPRKLRKVQLRETEEPLPELPESFVLPDRWCLVLAGAWRDPGVIHEFEARTTLIGLQRISRSEQFHGGILLSAGDNMGAILAFEKGRASSYELLAQCRRGAAYQIACEIGWRHRHVRTKSNVADAASRWADAGLLRPGDVKRGPFPCVTHLRPLSRPPLAPLASSSRTSLSSSSVLSATSLPHYRPRDLPPCDRDAASPDVVVHEPSLRDSSSASPSPRSSRAPSGSCAACVASLPTAASPGKVPSKAIKHLSKSVRTSIDKTIANDLSKLTEIPKLSNSCLDHVPRQKFFLELFSGDGFLTGALRQLGLHTLPPMDVKFGAHCDLTCKKVRSTVIGWLRSGRIWCVHLATPCTRWTTARTTGRKEPQGSLEVAIFSARVLRVCRQLGIRVSLENPRTSALFRWQPIRKELDKLCAVETVTDMCQYGVPFKKPTSVWSTIDTLPVALGKRCTCGKHSVVLEGLVKIKEARPVWRTSLAACYPPRFCHAYGRALGAVAPSGAWRRAAHEASNVQRRFRSSLERAGGCDGSGQPLWPECPSRPFAWWRVGRDCWSHVRSRRRG